MKKLVLFVFLGIFSYAQSQNFTLITDTNNPIVSTPPSSQANNPNFAYTGCTWIDVNQDNWIDLFYSGHLFINQNGQFSAAAGVTNSGPTALTSSSWADFDNDGDPDLLYAHPSGGTQIFSNDGSGQLQAYNSILDTINSITWSAQWSDYNNDGYADIILTFAEGFLGNNHFPCRLYKGSSAGTFTPVLDPDVEFLNDLHPYTVSNWIDYDQDGDQDLFIASGPGGTGAALDFLYQNQLKETGEEKFTRIISPAFATQTQDGQCYNFIDMDNDGDLDMCLTNWASGTTNRMYRNDNGNYAVVLAPFALSTNSNSLSNAWGDMDNDGYIDVIIASNNVIGNYYHNDGNGNFTDRGQVINPIGGTSSGLTLGDYDNDGDLDFFTVGLEKGLFRNDLDNDNNFINLQLSGGPSNKAALGARVKIKTSLNGETVWQRREVSGQNTFMGHNSLRVHFGLGKAISIDSLVVNWPSGQEDVFTDIVANKFYGIEEAGDITKLIAVNIREIPEPTLQYQLFPNPAKEQIQIVFEENIQKSIALKLYNTIGQVMGSQVFSPSQNIVFPLHQIPTGEYLLSIEAGEVRATEQVFVK